MKYLLFPLRLIADLFRMLVTYLPGVSGLYLRRIYYRRLLKSCGKNVTIDIGVLIDGCEYISIGDNVHIDRYCVIQAGPGVPGRISRKPNADFVSSEGELVIGSNVHLVQFCIVMAHGGVQIGDHCTLSAGCRIYSATNTPHNLEDPARVVSIMPYAEADFLMGPVVLHPNVWLGLGTIVMPGVSIGRNSFARINSVVLQSAAENSILDGMPAQKKRNRFG